MEKELIQIQLALFFKNLYEGDFEKVSLSLKSKLGSTAKTLIPPIPNDVPNDVPRLSLFFDNYNINVAKNRLDIFAIDFETINDVFEKIHDSDTDLIISRIGFVKTYFAEGDIETVKPLLNEHLKTLDIKDLRLRINKNSTIEGSECNNIEAVNMGSITKNEDGDETSKTGLIITRDINQIPQEDSAISKEDQLKIIKAFNSESNNFDLITE